MTFVVMIVNKVRLVLNIKELISVKQNVNTTTTMN